MSLRTKMLLIIFIFQTLVFGFLTLIFALEETRRVQREGARDAEVLGRLIQDWAISIPAGPDQDVNWPEFNRRLRESRLVAHWVVVRRQNEKLETMTSDAAESMQAMWSDADRLTRIFKTHQVDAWNRNVY